MEFDKVPFARSVETDRAGNVHTYRHENLIRSREDVCTWSLILFKHRAEYVIYENDLEIVTNADFTLLVATVACKKAKRNHAPRVALFYDDEHYWSELTVKYLLWYLLLLKLTSIMFHKASLTLTYATFTLPYQEEDARSMGIIYMHP